jgi:ABC-type uncharacterized transport system involved in gliding motility auxiliary subunit
MKNKSLETFLYSAGGVIALFLVLVGINVIATRAKTRIDLTEEKAFTLSQGTKAILKNLDTPVEIRFYVSQDNTMPPFLQTFARQVEDLLDEYAHVSKGKVRVQKFNPEPDSDAEDSARMDGIEGQMLRNGEKIYLGLVVSQLEEKMPFPLLDPQRERLLEYDISRAISRVSNPTKPTVGLLSGLPVFGMPMNPMMMRMGQQGGQEPWSFVSELKKDFNVKQLDAGLDKIDDDIRVLLVVHPKDLSDKAQFAIDQFVLRGGKLIAFLDPNAYFDPSGRNPQMQGMQMPSAGSNLDKLLKAWGIEFEVNKVLADLTYAHQSQRGLSPAVLSLDNTAVASNDVVTAQVDLLLLPFAGIFTGTPVAGLNQTVLLKSSPSSQLVDKFMAQMAGEQIANEFKSTGKEQVLALRLSGKFKTAFPDGQPKDPAAGTNAAPASAGNFLKEGTGENSVILVGDADMLNDAVSVQVMEVFGQRVMRPVSQNLVFLQNAVEQMAGDQNLIQVRSRASRNRPFTVVREMNAKAEEAFRGQIKALEDSLADTQRRLNELQANKDNSQRFIMSPEQQKELENFQKKQGDTNRKLKDLRKSLRQEIVSLETRLKWLNILAMPVAVALTGLVLAMVKRKRSGAK